MGCLGILTLALIAFKIAGIIDWSWTTIIIPTVIGAVGFIIFTLISTFGTGKIAMGARRAKNWLRDN